MSCCNTPRMSHGNRCCWRIGGEGGGVQWVLALLMHSTHWAGQRGRGPALELRTHKELQQL